MNLFMTRLEAVLDFRKDGMPVSMPNFDMDDMNVFECCLKDSGTEIEAVA